MKNRATKSMRNFAQSQSRTGENTEKMNPTLQMQQQSNLSKQLYKLAFGKPIEQHDPAEGHSAKNVNSMKYFNEINKHRNKALLAKKLHIRDRKRTIAAEQIGLASQAGVKSVPQIAMNIKPHHNPEQKQAEKVSSKSQKSIPNRIQKSVQFRAASVSYDSDQLNSQMPNLPIQKSKESLPAIQNQMNTSMQGQQLATTIQSQPSSTIPKQYRYEIYSGGGDDENKSYKISISALNNRHHEPKIISNRDKRIQLTTNFSSIDQSKTTKYEVTRNSWQPGASSSSRYMMQQTPSHLATISNFDRQSKQDQTVGQYHHAKFLNTSTTNRTFKVPQKDSQPYDAKQALTITDQKVVKTQKVLFKSHEGGSGGTTKKQIHNPFLIKNTQKVKNTQQINNRYNNQLTIQVKDNRQNQPEKNRGILQSPDIKKGSQNVENDKSNSDLPVKQLRRTVGFQSKSTVSFINYKNLANGANISKKVQEESKDYSSDDIHHQVPRARNQPPSFLTSLPDDPYIAGGKLISAPADKSKSALCLSLPKDNMVKPNLNTLNKIRNKFSKEQIRILGNPSQYQESNYTETQLDQNVKNIGGGYSHRQISAFQQLIGSCKTIQPNTDTQNTWRSIMDQMKQSSEQQSIEFGKNNLKIETTYKPDGLLKSSNFRKSHLNFERNSSMALITRRSDNYPISVCDSDLNKSIDLEQQQGSPPSFRQSAMLGTMPGTVTGGGFGSYSTKFNIPSSHAIDIDKVNRNIEQKLVNIVQSKSKDKSKMQMNIQNVQAMSMYRKNLELHHSNISKREKNQSQVSFKSKNSISYSANENREKNYDIFPEKEVKSRVFNNRYINSSKEANERYKMQEKMKGQLSNGKSPSPSPPKSPDVMLMEQAMDLNQNDKNIGKLATRQTNHQNYVAYVSDKLLQIYNDMHNYDITLDDLNSKSGLIQSQIKKQKQNENQSDSLQLKAISSSRRPDSRNKGASPVRTDRLLKESKKQEMKAITSKEMNDQKSKVQQQQNGDQTDADQSKIEEMTPEEAIAALKAFIPPPGPVNHVKQNIALSSKINKIRDIQLFYRNYIKDQNRKEAQRFIQEVDMIQRQCSLSQMEKWQIFKQKRDLIVDRYAQIKKKMLWVKFIVTIVKCHQQVNRFQVKYQASKLKRAVAVSKHFIALRGAVLWKIKLRRYGKKKLFDQQRGQIKCALTFFTQIAKSSNAIIHKQQQIELKQFFENQAWWAMLQTIKNQTIYFHKQIHFIQKRIQEKLQTLEAKVDIIRFYWEKMHIAWYRKAKQIKDKGMENILIRVAQAKPEIREFILQNYIRQCKKRYAIAFLEWRQHFSLARRENQSSTQLEDVEIEELITGREDFMLEEFKSHLEHFNLSSETIKYGVFETIKSYQAYGFDSGTTSQHLVNNLSNIGWTDPFPSPVRVKTKHVDPKPSKDDIQKHLEYTKEYNLGLLNRDFMHKAFKINPIVHIVKMRANSTKLRQEFLIQQKLAKRLKDVFGGHDKFVDNSDARTTDQGFPGKQKTKRNIGKSKSRSKGKKKKQSTGSVLKSPKKEGKDSKDISFDLATLNSSHQDIQVDMVSQESSLQEVREEDLAKEVDPIDHFRLHAYEKYIKQKDKDWLREAMLSNKKYNLTYQIQRYDEGSSPMCVYIPSNEVLFKLMRATIGIKKVEDIWIYNAGYSSYIQNDQQ